MCKELYIPQDRFIWIFSGSGSLMGHQHLNYSKGSITLYSSWFPVSDPYLQFNNTQDRSIPMVLDSVFLLASAIRDFCLRDQHLCHSLKNSKEKYKKITHFIGNTTIKSTQGHNISISFDENRNVPVQYNIYQYQYNLSRSPYYNHTQIGIWNTEKRLMIWEDPRWFTEEGDRIPGYPVSWSNQTCHDMDEPSLNNTLDQEVVFLGQNLNNPWAWVPLSVSIVGILCTCGVLAVFLVYRHTPIIEASGKELCYIMLGGIILCYFFACSILLEPTKVNCCIVKQTMGLGYIVCYSAIFMRLNQIYSIHMKPDASAWSQWRLLCLNPKFQILFCFVVASVQIVLNAIWMATERASVYSDPLDEKHRLTFCLVHGESILLGVTLDFLLNLMNIFYSIKTRNITKNFNEARRIGFVMYASFVGWMLFWMNYFLKSPVYRTYATVMTIGPINTGFLLLGCIFFPKVYVVLFKPEKNVISRPSSKQMASEQMDETCPRVSTNENR